MSSYEQKAWAGLLEHWEKRSNRRGLPNWASKAIDGTGAALSTTGERIARATPDGVKKPIRRATNVVADSAVRPAMEGAVKLLELVNDWALELNDPTFVTDLAKKRGIDIENFDGLRTQDLKTCDRLLGRNTLVWRTTGAAEGAAMGALALVPIAGIPAAITADIVVIQVLSTSIAARIAYSYGFDAKDPEEQAFIQRLVRRSFLEQATKAAPLREVNHAAQMARGRVNWSSKLRADSRLLASLEKVMKHLGPGGAHVSVQSVAKVVPAVGILIGAGVNSMTLGRVAEDAKRYCQTRFLSEKYGLPLPDALSFDIGEEPDIATMPEDSQSTV